MCASLAALVAMAACGDIPSSTAPTGNSQALTSDTSSTTVSVSPTTLAPTSTAAPTTPATPPSEPATTAATTSTAAPTTTAADPQCATLELSGSIGDGDGGAGQLYQPLVLTNIGGRSCTIEGYPDVTLLDGDGNPIGNPADREPIAPIAITLGPGQQASALLHTTNGPIGGLCAVHSVSISVVPPDETTALEFDAVYTACGGFSVRPFVAGPAGI